MDKKYLENIARQLVAPGKGILAADESTGTIEKRFAVVNVENTESNRQEYRELLFTTPGIEEFISGVILFDKTIKQKTDSGLPFPKVLEDKDILVGIKVDLGKVEMPGFSDEFVTEGIDGLVKRLELYKSLGAKFAKWRAVFPISDKTPGAVSIRVNCELLARYAAICQSLDIVPIIEPEVLMDGNHSIEKSYDVNVKVLKQIFTFLFDHKVAAEGVLVKSSFVHPGKENKENISSEKIADMTIKYLKEAISVAVPGIVFLSGGDSPEESTDHLNEMNKIKASRDDLPWELSFSFGRALQEPVLKAWDGKSANTKVAQQEFYKRAKLNSLARTGNYSKVLET